jgi:hypothetical protein
MSTRITKYQAFRIADAMLAVEVAPLFTIRWRIG